MKKKPRVCELCSAEAALYCASDAAYLCWSCDAGVHKANFLVARHVRRTLCVCCGRLDGRLLSGAEPLPIRPLCRSCFSPEISDPCKSSPSSCSSSLSCSSDCVSSTERTGGQVRFRTGRSEPDYDYARAEGILVIWGRRLGLRSRRGWLALALRAVGVCVRRFPALPMRVRLACSLWLAGNACEPRGLSTWQLSRLEECSRVPRKLIRLGEAKLARAVRVKDDEEEEEEEEEGWAECSDG